MPSEFKTVDTNAWLPPARISLLPREVVERIAAGEVIERPVSVVRELIDNALDAGAASIRIELRDGGLRLIRVADDGCGIQADDLALAIQPHTTSKLHTLGELDSISTLGFRGEALASIAAVAELELTSASDNSGVAHAITLIPGLAPETTTISRPRGVTVTVRNLFATIPARRSLLRGAHGEATRIASLVRAYALAHPSVRFALMHDGRQILRTSGSDLAGTLTTLYGTDAARTLAPIGPTPVERATISGFVAGRSFSQPTREHITLAVNGRPILNHVLLAAIEAGYRPLLRKGRHPILAIAITVPPDTIDANIHPTKAEVLLRQERAIATALRDAVYASLASAPATVASVTTSSAPYASFFSHSTQMKLPAPRRRRGLRISESSTSYSAKRMDVVEESSDGALPTLEPLGQLDDTLILARSFEGHLYLVDQHRAHERILYERLRTRHASLMSDEGATLEQSEISSSTRETDPSQLLLEPLIVELSSLQAELLLPRLDELAQLGLECQHFGGSVFLVRAMPSLPGSAQPSTSYARELAQDAAADSNNWLEHLCISLACRSAIRRGQRLDISEQRALLHDLSGCPTHALCPHGSPLLLRYTKDFLVRAFEW